MISEELVYSTIDELKLMYNHAKRLYGKNFFKKIVKEDIRIKLFDPLSAFNNDPIKFLEFESTKKVLEEFNPMEKLCFLGLVYELSIKKSKNGNS